MILSPPIPPRSELWQNDYQGLSTVRSHTSSSTSASKDSSIGEETTKRLRITNICSSKVKDPRAKDVLLSVLYMPSMQPNQSHYLIGTFARRMRWPRRKPFESEAVVSGQNEACNTSNTVLSEPPRKSTATRWRGSRAKGKDGENQKKRLMMPLQPETPSPEPSTSGKTPGQ